MRNVLYCREYDWRSALSILIPAARRRLSLVFPGVPAAFIPCYGVHDPRLHCYDNTSQCYRHTPSNTGSDVKQS